MRGADARIGVLQPLLDGSSKKIVLPCQFEDGLGTVRRIGQAGLFAQIALERLPQRVIAGLKALDHRLANGFAVKIGEFRPVLSAFVVLKLKLQMPERLLQLLIIDHRFGLSDSNLGSFSDGEPTEGLELTETETAEA